MDQSPYLCRLEHPAQRKSLKEVEEEAKTLGEMNRRLAAVEAQVRESLFNWEHNREAELEGMHPAAKAYLLEEWKKEKQAKIRPEDLFEKK